MNNLTILVFSFRKSEIMAWINRHHDLQLAGARLICAYHLDDSSSHDAPGPEITFLRGQLSGTARILQCLDLIRTKYVMLAAGDDQIISLPGEGISGKSTAIAGTYFINRATHLAPSSNNTINFQHGTAAAAVEYWTPANPGDNCLFYSVFDTSLFARIFPSVGDAEASDWYFVHRCLIEGVCERSSSFIVVRQPPPRDNHYTRRFVEALKRTGAGDADLAFHNPILYSLQRICRATPADLIPSLRKGWSEWIKMKFHEMAAASQRYRAFVERSDIEALSMNLANHLGDLDERRLLRL